VFNTVIVSLTLVLIFRVYLVMDMRGPSWIKKDEFHQNRTWAAAVKAKTNGLPFVSMNSYQQASKYWFYTGIQSYSLNTPDYRRNNFNYWPVSDSLLGKTVFVYGRYDPQVFKDSMPGRTNNNGGTVIDSFFSFSKLQFLDIRNVQAQNGIVTLNCKVSVPGHYLDVFQTAPYNSAKVQIGLFNNDSVPHYHNAEFRVDSIRQREMDIRLSFKVPITSGEHMARLATESRVPYHPTLNSGIFSFTMK
jgi:hypothetical protein